MNKGFTTILFVSTFTLCASIFTPLSAASDQEQETNTSAITENSDATDQVDVVEITLPEQLPILTEEETPALLETSESAEPTETQEQEADEQEIQTINGDESSPVNVDTSSEDYGANLAARGNFGMSSDSDFSIDSNPYGDFAEVME